MKKVLISGIIILSLGATVFSQLGGYKSVAVDDERVTAAAEFAVGKRAEDHTEQEGLKLDTVEKAEMQTVAGINYRLCLAVSLGDETQQVRVLVYQNLQQEYSLKSWAVEDCSPKSGEITSGNILSLQKINYTRPSQPAFSNCSGNQLSLSEGEGDADMGGKRFGNYIFTNISSSACTLSGFPVFTLLNKAGQVMPGVTVTYVNALFHESEDEVGKKPPLVTLEPGKTAWFQIFYTDGMANNLKRPPASSAKVKVKAPQTTKEFIIKSEVGAYKMVQVSSIRPEPAPQ